MQGKINFFLHFLMKWVIVFEQLRYSQLYAPVAQLDRVSGYEPEGRGFESLPAYQKPSGHICVCWVFIMIRDVGTRNELLFLLCSLLLSKNRKKPRWGFCPQEESPFRRFTFHRAELICPLILLPLLFSKAGYMLGADIVHRLPQDVAISVLIGKTAFFLYAF